MGQDITTEAIVDGKRRKGRVLLETDYLLWRGTDRLKIPFTSMRSVKARDGSLIIKHREGEIAIELGTRAAKWEDKILHPPTVLDKLGVKEAQRVSILGAGQGSLPDEVAARTGEEPSARVRKDSDIIFLFAEDHRDLERIGKLRGSIKPDGAIWVVYPKSRKEMTENDVIEGGRSAGMKDVKVVRYSDTHTGLKMVIPVAER